MQERLIVVCYHIYLPPCKSKLQINMVSCAADPQRNLPVVDVVSFPVDHWNEKTAVVLECGPVMKVSLPVVWFYVSLYAAEVVVVEIVVDAFVVVVVVTVVVTVVVAVVFEVVLMHSFVVYIVAAAAAAVVAAAVVVVAVVGFELSCGHGELVVAVGISEICKHK